MRNTLKKFSLLVGLLAFILFTPSKIYAETNTEDMFKDIFLTAGYTALLGGMLGASAMFISTKPISQNLRWVGVGASLGFTGGTILGTYFVLGPAFVAKNKQTSDALLSFQNKKLNWNVPLIAGSVTPTPWIYGKIFNAVF